MFASFPSLRSHQVIHMQQKISSSRNNSSVARNWIKSLTKLTMCCDKRTDIRKRMVRRFKRTFKFGGSLGPRLRKRHLDAAIGVDLAIGGSFDR